MKIKPQLFILLFLALYSNCSSSKTLKFKHLEISDSTRLQIIRGIEQDQNGLIWIATYLDGLYSYDGYDLKKTAINSSSEVSHINNIAIDSNKHLWVATENSGLYYRNGHDFDLIEHGSAQLSQVKSLEPDHLGGMWATSDKNLNYISSSKEITNYPLKLKTKTVLTDIEFINQHSLLIGSNDGLYIYDINTKELSTIKTGVNSKVIRNIDHQTTLIGANTGLFLLEHNTKTLSPYFPTEVQSQVTSILVNHSDIWVGTLLDGLYHINLTNQTIQNYIHDTSNPHSLSDINVVNLFFDNEETLWVGTFNNGINLLNERSTQFGFEANYSTGFNCSDSSVINHVFERIDESLWLATEKGVVDYSPSVGSCSVIGIKSDDFSGELSHSFVYEIIEDDNLLWVSTGNGLNKINLSNKGIDTLEGSTPRINTTFSYGLNSKQRLLGTKSGLYIYDSMLNISKKLEAKQSKYNNIFFYDYSEDLTGGFYLASEKGVFYLKNGLYEYINSINEVVENHEVLSIHFDQKSRLWVGTFLNGLFLFDHNGQLLKRFNSNDGIAEDISINSMLEKDNILWMGTNIGLLRIDINNFQNRYFYESDGLQSNFFIKAAAHKGQSGKFYFGGRNGFNSFFPNEIKTKLVPPSIVLTHLKRFNKNIEPNISYEGFTIDQPIDDLKQLTLSYKDYVIAFEFAALSYIDPNKIKYRYKLEGFDPDWNYVDANDRTATYTNLPRGNYTFRVKASNKDGVWNEPGKSIKIKVLPAPWLSWWAFTSYLLAMILMIIWLINKKLASNRKIAALLRTEVAVKTKELEAQKQTVESLLAKKNELFSNVSHEFRTPLTLILGPMNELIEESQTSKSRQTLTVLKRNANRLLSLVEQLLQLAKTSDFKQARFSTQETSEQVKAIIDSFQHLAQDQNIELQLQHNDHAYISATDQCLDATLGNLVSNAIKYTSSSGLVTVNSIQKHKQLVIEVKDQGAGLNEQQKLDIFKRFKRLDAHQNIEGIGIGLSVVKELTEINNGSIRVESELGVGSQFTIILPTVDKPNEIASGEYQPGTLMNQLSNDQVDTSEVAYENELVSDKNIVLVIEDNHDMRNHIVSVLEKEFHCLQAQNGKEGVANALKFVPDLIVCDVMMPEMDGFKVSRIIRSDQRTSHIPLILLTALNDRENRIKGWREHVDMYMTKPFDREELLIQVENIITIRNILTKKTQNILKEDKSISHSDLPKKDKEFIDKLFKIIEKNYQDSQLNRDKIAAAMAVSDRQLQRKIKALIDQNPMDILREYRLKRAAEKLKEGYQVGQCSDEVGFKTPTHFSQCFKAQYGLTPKQYQQQFNR